VLPNDTPAIAGNRVAQTLSPLLWALHKPDRFDTWCAGMVMLQLCFSSLRSDAALLAFKRAYQGHFGFDLAAWAEQAQLPAAERQVLDQDGGAGGCRYWARHGLVPGPRSVLGSL
jgi:hypothetical protein